MEYAAHLPRSGAFAFFSLMNSELRD